MNSESLAASEVLPPRRRLWPRIVLAGPLTVICSVLVMCGGSLWLPKGAAQIDNIVLPIGLSLLHALAIALHVMEVRA